MLKTFPLIPIIFLFFCYNLTAQTDDTEDDNASFFDDGNNAVANRKNVLKLDFISTLNGDLSIQYERAVNKRFSVEIGVGRILPYYVPEFHILINPVLLTIEDPNHGYSLWFHPKYYFMDKVPKSYYTGVQLRRRYYNIGSENEIFTHNDLILTAGRQFMHIKQRLAIDFNSGYGLRFRKYKNDQGDVEKFQLFFQFSLKLGYFF